MCFSASASFIAGVALSTVGVATLRMTKRKREIPLATIPLLFGMQQISEGLIWLSFRSDSSLPDSTLTLVYSLFSHVLWPIFVPFAVGLYLFYAIVQFPVTARVLGQHIVYESPHFYIVAVMTFYLVATCISSLLSSRVIIRMFGALSLITFLAAYVIHAATLVSMWCFFAAVLSFIVYCYFRRERSTALGEDSAPTMAPQ